MTFDSRTFRNALGVFATGITIVTVESPVGHPVGLTVNSFSSVSLDPPLVLWSLDRASDRAPLFAGADRFGINVLAADQQALSDYFAFGEALVTPAMCSDEGPAGIPVLKGVLAAFECLVERRIDAGDHIIYLGRVMRLLHAPSGAPLVYFRGEYRALTE